MSSILAYFKENGLEYHASSLTHFDGRGPENGFAKTDSYFNSQHSPSRQWWQVSFSRPVVISKYIITFTSGHSVSPISWEVSVSNDNVDFKTIKTQTTDTICGNIVPFSLDSPVSCEHFRLTMNKPNTNNNEGFFFRGFDCFSDIKRHKITQLKCLRNTVNLILLFPFVVISK